MEKPTTYEKNNLPIMVRKKYCEVIEKYQLIQHYENGIIKKDELILELLKENKEDNCKHKNITHIGEIDEWYCKSCFNLVYWDKENNNYKL
jgi:hypothetical protein